MLPEKWVISDTYSNTGQIKDTGCPAEYDETILMPFVYKNFVKFIGFDVLPSEGSLQSGNILLQIDEDYRQAIEILKELEPQSESVRPFMVWLGKPCTLQSPNNRKQRRIQDRLNKTIPAKIPPL